MRIPYGGVNGTFSNWNALATQLKCTQPAGSTAQFACMKKVSSTDLINAVGSSNLQFVPIDDDITRSSAPTALTKSGKVANVPILAGTVIVVGSTRIITFY